jgi:hypothetical protein
MSYKEQLKNEIKDLLEKTPLAPRNSLRYLIYCGMQKIKDKDGTFYYKLNTNLIIGNPIDYIRFIYNSCDVSNNDSRTSTTKYDIINDFIDIYRKMPAFPNEENCFICVDKHKDLDVKLNTWSFNKWNSVALVYIAEFICNIGFHSKYGKGFRKKITKLLIKYNII